MTRPSTRTLYLVACAAPPARRLGIPVSAAQAAGWEVCVILTPSAYRWAAEDAEGEIEALQELTGHPVRWRYKLPSQPDVLPAPDALLVAPLTSNTLAKWATAVSDTLVLGLLTEGIGLGLPIIALPHWNAAQHRHPAVAGHVDTLRAAGVTMLLGDGGFVPHPPATATSMRTRGKRPSPHCPPDRSPRGTNVRITRCWCVRRRAQRASARGRPGSRGRLRCAA